MSVAGVEEENTAYVLLVHLFDLYALVFVYFRFLLVSEVSCSL